jgi:hypothetical protein
MTPEEAAAWAAAHPRVPSTPATINAAGCCSESGCLSPIYLDGMCADHWRLLLGWSGHRRREAALAELQAIWEAS